MSFAAKAKKEITSLDISDDFSKDELAALIRMNGVVSMANRSLVLNVQTENPAIARHIYTLLKHFYQVDSDLLVRRKMKLNKNNVYIVRLKQDTLSILEDLSIMDDGMFTTDVSGEILGVKEKMIAYLRGAFLASGSVNNPETSSYHLEIYSLYEDHNQDICEMMNYFNLNAKTLNRRNGFITYLKGIENIKTFLSLIGATNSRLKIEDITIYRDIKNNVNRLMNCETANMNKVVNASAKQIENIKYIDQIVGLDALPEKLRELAEVRLKYPEDSLKELGEVIPGGPISKSGINHRIRKINEFAEKLRKENS